MGTVNLKALGVSRRKRGAALSVRIESTSASTVTNKRGRKTPHSGRASSPPLKLFKPQPRETDVHSSAYADGGVPSNFRSLAVPKKYPAVVSV
jgi:hypothetical protein